MNVAVKKFRLYGITPLLGSISMNKQTFEDYLATKAKTAEEAARAEADVENVVDQPASEVKATGFYRDAETGKVILKAYQIKGFLKEAAKALKDQLDLASYVSKIDNLVFIEESNIPLMRDGEQVVEPDNVLSRPLRAQTAQGPRVALAYSEMVEAPWYIDITLKVIENKGTLKSKALDMDMVEEMLAYGQLKGLLQWRNGGYGSFKAEELA